MKWRFLAFILLPLQVFAQSERSKNQGRIYQWYESRGICLDTVTKPELYFDAYQWAGTRYHYGQAQKQKGTDCSGFVCAVYKDVYCLDLSRSSCDIWPMTLPVKKKDLAVGDLVFFKIQKGRISHVGIYLGNNKFIHAAVKGGVIVSDLDEPYYNRYFFMGGRVLQSDNP
jgi:lipoprotein Spr